MPSGEPGSPDVRAKMMSWVAWCRPELKRLCPLSTHSSPSCDRGRLEERGVRPVVRLGEAEGQPAGAVEEAGHPLGLLRVGAEVAHHQHRREVADDRALVLQVVVQAEALVGEVLADDRHLEVAGVAAAELGREREPQPAGGVGPPAHLARAAPPSRPAARRRARSRCGPTRAGGRRTARCRPAPASGAISCSMKASSCVERGLDVHRDVEVHRRNLTIRSAA